MTEISSQERDYLPGMGKHYLMPFYDLLHRVSGLAAVHDDMVGLAGLRAGQRVLDVGCGTGNLLRATGKRHRDVELAGVDPDLKMLARAEGKLRRAGLGARLDRGFAQELAFADDSFDAVFSSLMLHHLDGPSKGEMLAEVRRVLKPGGVLVLADIAQHGHVAEGIAAAGFTLELTRTRKLRMFGEVGIEVAKVH
ncbi:class I SAM-dependent methyltransferase [Lentzea sp. HUAS12]|uniref:class I SAM-dependent methyltransferase n=1 Tax=Lentzea sp. HUAS12 TaxID=2951806 RepID=UPI0020A2267E|nr:class I SAM-dependent methyltransferase [Lentzea sp. HUAS12]USX54980.1 methyltransferase domain-containing protein [Lentzea sp. HUAS12]